MKLPPNAQQQSGMRTKRGENDTAPSEPSSRTEQTELPEKVAMTGSSSFLGNFVLKRLAELPTVREIHLFDIRAPDFSSSKVIFHRLDLTRDTADSEMAATLLANDISTFVHGALFSGPGRGQSQRREVESIGTFHVLNAVAEAKVKKLVVFSSTFVYGANSQNPNFLTENSPLRPLGPDFVKTRVDVERQLKEFSTDYPATKMTVLRFAPILGPNSTDVRARYFLVGIIPKVLGYDPLLQFIHEDDALRAALLGITSSASGVFNVVGKGVLPLSTGIHMSGKIPVPAATPLCKTVFSVGFLLRIWDLPASIVPFFQYLCVADGRKAEGSLGFTPRYSSRQALKSMIEAQRLRKVGFAVPTVALGEDQGMAAEQGFERVF